MTAKFNIDEKVHVTGKVIEINSNDDGIFYQLKIKTTNGSMVLNFEEGDLAAIVDGGEGGDDIPDTPVDPELVTPDEGE